MRAKRQAAKLLESDFLTPPAVEAIELSGYNGRAGDTIRVIATVDVAVTIAIRDTHGALRGEGPATEVHGVWLYQAQHDGPGSDAATIEATATDRPGNRATARQA